VGYACTFSITEKVNFFSPCLTGEQKVQKSEAKPGQEEKPDFAKESSGFTGQEDFNQTEDAEKKQPDAEDYHRRDTYR